MDEIILADICQLARLDYDQQEHLSKYTLYSNLYRNPKIYEFVRENWKTTVIPHRKIVWEVGLDFMNHGLVPKALLNEFCQNLLLHDLSKFSAIEALALAHYNDDNDTDYPWQDGWNHHKRHNPHHVEYWIDCDMYGQATPLEIPKVFLLEMLVDWGAASLTSNTSFQEWIKKEFNQLALHPKSRNRLSRLIQKLK